MQGTESAMCESHFAREIMLLFKWIKVKKPVLSFSSTCAYSSLSKKDLDNTNKEVNLNLERMRIDYITHCCALLTLS